MNTIQFNKRLMIAERLAARLRELADACVQAAKGNDAAKRMLRNATDKYWFALVVGASEVEELFVDIDD